MLKLANDEMLPERLVELTPTHAVMSLGPEQVVRIDRANVTGIRLAGGMRKVVYEGPGEESDWIQHASARRFRFRDGAMRTDADGFASLALEFPAQYQVDLVLATRSGSYHAQLGLQVQTPNQNQDGYWLELTPHLTRITQRGGDGHREIGKLDPSPVAGIRGELPVRVYVDRVAAEITLEVAGVRSDPWRIQPHRSIDRARHLVLMVHQGHGYEVRSLRVTSWDGHPPQTPGSEPDGADAVVLTNQDVVTGRLEEIQNDTVRVVGSFGPLEIPSDRVAAIRLARTGRQDAGVPPEGRTSTIHFRAGGILSGGIVSRVGEVLTLRQAAAGNVGIPVSWIRRVEFPPEAEAP